MVEHVDKAGWSSPTISAAVRNCLRPACRHALKRRRTVVGTEHMMFALQTRMYGVGPVYFSKRYLRRCLRNIDTPDDRRWRFYSSDKAELRDLMARGGPLPGHSWLRLDPGPGDVPPQVEDEVQATLSEVAWWACNLSRRRRSQWSDVRWTASAQAALRRTLLFAQAKGVARAGIAHLMAGVLAGPGNGATDLMCLRGHHRAAELWHLVPDQALERESFPIMPLSGHLAYAGLPTQPPERLFTWLDRIGLVRFPGGYLVGQLEVDARRQAIRLRQRQVGAAHLVLSIVGLHEQLVDSDETFRADLAPYCRAGDVLRAHKIRYHDAVACTASLPASDAPHLPPDKSRRWRREVAGLSFGEDLVATVDVAREHAARLGHPEMGTSHLLVALLAAPDAVMLVRSLGVDPDTLARDAAALLPGGAAR